MLLFSHLVVSNSLQAHGLQHTRPPCPEPSLKVCPSSCPLHQWCHPAISSSDTLSSFCLQSFSASGTFPMSQLFTSGDQNTGASASASILPKNIQDWFSLELTGLNSLESKGALNSLFQHHSSKTSILWCSAFFIVQLSHPYMPAGKTIALTRPSFVGQVMSLLFNMLSRFVIAFLPRGKRLLISWLQSLSSVTLEPKKIKFVTVCIVPPSIALKQWDWMPWSSFLNVEL